MSFSSLSPFASSSFSTPCHPPHIPVRCTRSRFVPTSHVSFPFFNLFLPSSFFCLCDKPVSFLIVFRASVGSHEYFPPTPQAIAVFPSFLGGTLVFYLCPSPPPPVFASVMPEKDSSRYPVFWAPLRTPIFDSKHLLFSGQIYQ